MHISISPDVLFTVFGFPVTNTFIMSLVAIAILITLALFIARAFSGERRGVLTPFKNAVEFFIEKLYLFLETLVEDRAYARTFFPIVATIFVYILLANWMGILPGVGSIGITEVQHGEATLVPLFRSVYSDLNMTLALGAFTVILSHAFGVMAVGARHHAGKYFTVRNPLMSFVGILEAFGEVSKVVSLSFRLFGNIFAGEVLLVIVLGLLPFIAPIPFMFMELFVGLVQALIFAVLAMVSFASAVRVAEH